MDITKFMEPSENAFNKAKDAIRALDSAKYSQQPKQTNIISKVTKDIRTIKIPIARYFENPAQLTYMYAESEYDIVSVFKLLKHEPFFLKATQKILSLFTKSGMSIHSDDDEKKKYITNRFKLMQLETGFSINSIIKQLAFYLIASSNAFLIKTRSNDPKYGHSYIKDNKEVMPISGLFTAHPVTMKPKFKFIKDSSLKTGVRLILDKWVHTNRRGIQKEFDPNDVCHFTLFKEDGMLFGLPEVMPVIDDIRTLRKLEEDSQLLVHRDLFPIIHYTVEEPSLVDHQTGFTELDRAQSDMKNIVQDGGIATDARHEIKFVGNEGKGIDINPFIKYFQQRVLAGLGVSEIDLGIGGAASNGTADTLSSQIIDSVKFIQQELAQQFKELILDEIMLQSQYNDIFDEETEVKLVFQETDLEWKIRSENHEADLFQKGIKTIHETRNKMGHKTISDEDLENYTSTGISNKFALQQEELKNKLSAADNDPVKSAKSNSNIVKHKDMLLQDKIESISLQDEFKAAIEEIYSKKGDKPNKLDIILATKYIYDSIKSNMIDSVKNGVKDASKDLNIEDSDIDLQHNIFGNLDSIRDEIVDLVYKDKNNINKAAIRVATANRTNSYKAYNYGYALTGISNGSNKFVIHHNTSTDISSDSMDLLGKELELNTGSILRDIPPYRPNQRVYLRIKKNGEQNEV
jgi:hypothetical protein